MPRRFHEHQSVTTVRGHRAWRYSLLTLGALVHVLSLWIYHARPEWAWYSGMVWLVSFVVLFLAIYEGTAHRQYLTSLRPRAWSYLLLVVAVAALLRFVGLQEIPILSHDEGRDPGLRTIEFFTERKINPFQSFYALQNFFHFVPTISHLLFEDDILKVRFLSAFLGTLSVAITFLIAKVVFGLRTALITGLLLATYHYHFHFCRTDPALLIDSFWLLVVILVALPFLRRPTFQRAVILGMMSGFVLHFYSSAKSASLITMLFSIFIVRKSRRLIVGLFIGLVIGVGPTWIEALDNPESFIAQGNARLVWTGTVGIVDCLEAFAVNLWETFAGVFSRPLVYQFQRDEPLLTFPFYLFPVIGLVGSLRIRRRRVQTAYLACLLIGILIINSALLTQTRQAHRLVLMFPILIVFTGYGVLLLMRIMETKVQAQVVVSLAAVLVTCFAYRNIDHYFVQKAWMKTQADNAFRAWHIARWVKRGAARSVKVLFLGSHGMPSYRSVPSLEYLLRDYKIVDVREVRDLAKELNEANAANVAIVAIPNAYVKVELADWLGQWRLEILRADEVALEERDVMLFEAFEVRRSAGASRADQRSRSK